MKIYDSVFGRLAEIGAKKKKGHELAPFSLFLLSEIKRIHEKYGLNDAHFQCRLAMFAPGLLPQKGRPKRTSIDDNINLNHIAHLHVIEGLTQNAAIDRVIDESGCSERRKTAERSRLWKKWRAERDIRISVLKTAQKWGAFDVPDQCAASGNK